MLVFHCLYHSLKVFFAEKHFALISPPIAAFLNFTLDARSRDIYNLYANHSRPAIANQHIPRVFLFRHHPRKSGSLFWGGGGGGGREGRSESRGAELRVGFLAGFINGL